jgi:hypothetical protein
MYCKPYIYQYVVYVRVQVYLFYMHAERYFYTPFFLLGVLRMYPHKCDAMHRVQTTLCISKRVATH